MISVQFLTFPNTYLYDELFIYKKNSIIVRFVYFNIFFFYNYLWRRVFNKEETIRGID